MKWIPLLIVVAMSGCQLLDRFMPQALAPVSTPIPAGELAKENQELLSEMIKVVFHQDSVEDPAEYRSLTNSLNLGASLEGIYRGLVMGNRYRALENKGQAASPRLLKMFVAELVDLQASMKNPTEFEPEDAKKAPSIDFPDGSQGSNVQAAPGVMGKTNSQEVRQAKDKQVARDELLPLFIGASAYTLKRVLADEALRKFEELNNSPNEVADWYSKLVLHLCEAKVDFGLELRNRPDYAFHYLFAQKMAVDRVKWEVLNRYHRILNFMLEHE